MKIRIYSAGDDEIRVEGDIEAEGCARFEKRGYVVLDTGDVFGVGPGPEVAHIEISGRCAVERSVERSVDSSRLKISFRDVVVQGPFNAVSVYQSWPVDDEELKDLLEEAIERATVRGRFNLSRNKLITALLAIAEKPVVGIKPEPAQEVT